jgi:hypothetical protein
VTPRTIKLRQPIELRSAKTGDVISSIAELTLRSPKLGDLVAAMDAAGGGKSAGTMTLHLAARCTGVSAADLEGLGLEDGAELLEAVAGFMPAGLGTGPAISKSPPAPSGSRRTGDAGDQPS